MITSTITVLMNMMMAMMMMMQKKKKKNMLMITSTMTVLMSMMMVMMVMMMMIMMMMMMVMMMIMMMIMMMMMMIMMMMIMMMIVMIMMMMMMIMMMIMMVMIMMMMVMMMMIMMMIMMVMIMIMMMMMVMVMVMMMMMMIMMIMMMMMNVMNEGASRAQASPAIPCTSEPKSRAQARRLPSAWHTASTIRPQQSISLKHVEKRRLNLPQHRADMMNKTKRVHRDFVCSSTAVSLRMQTTNWLKCLQNWQVFTEHSRTGIFHIFHILSPLPVTFKFVESREWRKQLQFAPRC